MSLTRPILTIGFDKNGEADYALHVGDVAGLSFEQMQAFRAMIPVGIAQAEQYWIGVQMRKPENQASQSEKL